MKYQHWTSEYKFSFPCDENQNIYAKNIKFVIEIDHGHIYVFCMAHFLYVKIINVMIGQNYKVMSGNIYVEVSCGIDY